MIEPELIMTRLVMPIRRYRKKNGVDKMGLFSFIGKVTLSAVCLATPGAQVGVLPIWLDSAASGDGSDVGE